MRIQSEETVKSTWSFDSAKSLIVEHAAGPLTVRGHDHQKVLITAVSEPQHTAPDGDTVSFRFRGPSTLKAPDGIEITVDDAAGPFSLKRIRAEINIGDARGATHIADLDGPLTCTGSVFGPIRVTGAGPVSLNRCVGPLSASDIDAIELNESSGPVRVWRCAGPFHAKRLVGDATLGDISGNVEVDWLAGNLRLAGLLRGKNVWKATVQGSVTVWLHNASSARLKLVSESRDISVKGLELSDAFHVHEDGLFTGTIGDGQATLEIEAGGGIVLRRAGQAADGEFGLPFSTDEIGEGVEQMITAVESGLRNVGEEVSQSLRIDDDIRNLGGRIRERVQRDVDRFVRRQRRRARRAARRSGEPEPRRAETADAAGEEHAENTRTILRLVADRKINPDEAEKLLNALRPRR